MLSPEMQACTLRILSPGQPTQPRPAHHCPVSALHHSICQLIEHRCCKRRKRKKKRTTDPLRVFETCSRSCDCCLLWHCKEFLRPSIHNLRHLSQLQYFGGSSLSPLPAHIANSSSSTIRAQHKSSLCAVCKEKNW